MAEEYTNVFDDEQARKLVVAVNEGNDLADTEFARDIRSAPYAYLERKYGREVADNRRNYSEQRVLVDQIENQSRDAGQIVGDAALAVGSGFVNTVGSVVGAGLGGIGAVDEYFNEENDAISNYAVKYTDSTRRATEWIKSFQSQELADRRGLSGVEAQLDAEDNLAQYEEDTADRDANFIDDLAWVGRGALNNAGRVLSDPALTGDVVAEGIGSLGPSAKIASVASRAVTQTSTFQAAKIANAIAPTQGTKFLAMGADAVNRGAIAASVGATEAAGVYSQTVNEVLGMTHGQLLDSSEEYARMVESGVDPDDAKSTLAANAGIDAFKKSFPMASSLGIIAGKFEAMPMKSFRGEGFIGGLRQVGAQTLEEGGQGFTGQIATNTAIRDTGVDPEREALEGAPEALAVGAIAGTGMAGVMAAPSAVGNAPRQVANAARTASKELREGYNNSDAAQKLAAAAGSAAATGLDTAQAVGSAAVKSRAGQATISGAKAATSKVIETATPYVEAGNEAVAEFNSRPDRKAQTENLAALSNVAQLGETELTLPIDGNQSDKALNAELGRKATVKTLVREAASGPVPSTFQSTTPDNASTLSRVGGVLSKLTEKGVRINKLSDGDILYAAKEMQTLRNSIPSLPAAMQSEVKKVIASEEFKNIQKRATRIDLNKTQDETKAITNDMVQETKAIAVSNPANVNPGVVNKILEQDDRTDLTVADIKMMKVAKRIAEAITGRVDAEVSLETDRNVALSVKPEYDAGKKKLPEIKNVSNISRNIIIGKQSDNLSVAGFSGAIMEGIQSGGTVIQDGVPVDVKAQVVPRFRNFAQHMINKVGAVNTSYDKQDANGKGTNEFFESLNSSGRMVKPGEPGNAGSVYYHPSSPKSVATAQAIHADAVATVEVYNALAEAFPDMFPDGTLSVPELRGFETQTDLSDTNVPQDEAAPTVVEEVSAPAGTDETQDAESSLPTLEEMMAAETRTKEDFSQMSYEDLIESANRWFVEEEGMAFEPMIEERQTVVTDYTNAVISHFNLPTDLVTGVAWLRTPDERHLGQAMWGERLIGMRAGAIKTLMGDPSTDDFNVAEHIVFHELMHIIDAYASDDVTRPESHKSELFSPDPRANGLIYQEVIAATEADPELKADMAYVLSYDTIETLDELASELIADIGAMYMRDTEKTKRLFPEGVKYVEYLIEKAGGTVIESQATDGDTTQDSVETEVETGQPQSVGEKSFDNVSPKFKESFQKRQAEISYADGQGILSMVQEQPETGAYVEFVQKHLQNLMDAANNRLATMKVNEKTKGELPIKDRIINGDEEVGLYRRNKNTFMVDQTTGEYDPDLLSIAAVAVLDWLSGVRAANPKSLSDTLEDMGLTYDMLSEENIRDLTYGVPANRVAEDLAKDIVRMWGLSINKDVPMADGRGAAEGMAKELLEALVGLNTGLLQESKVPIYNQEKGVLAEQTVYNVFGMVEEQIAMGMEGQEAAKKMLAPELDTMPTIGAPTPFVDNTQARGDVKLSKREKNTLKEMQNQGHGLNIGLSDMTESIGEQALFAYLGKADFSLLGDRHPLRASIAGKNLSIERDYQEAMSVVQAIKNSGFTLNGELPQVFYRVGISKVGRHQFKGINPQNNKILRALVTPTKALLDMGTKAHKDAFWLTVAQASGLNKVENEVHSEILATIQQNFQDKFSDAVDLVSEYLEGGEMDGAALVEAMGGSGDMQQLSAVFAVAQLELAIQNGTEGAFETTLSFELDGKTDGPGNMMANFGQGILTQQDLDNFKRVGFFLGTKNMTLNKFFRGKQERDLYEVTSLKGVELLYNTIANAPVQEKERIHAVARMATAFGDLEMVDGQYVMTRNASKNPMTKTVYGSSERGIGQGLAQEMMMEMYRQLIANPDGITEYPGGNEQFVKDFEMAFQTKYPGNIDWNKSFLDEKSSEPFTKLVTQTLGKVLSDTAKQVIGDDITKVNDTLVLMTAFQTEFLTAKFEELLDAKVKARAGDGKPNRTAITQRDYDEVVDEIRTYSPTYANGMQTLDIGALNLRNSGITLSSAMDGNLRGEASMVTPALAGVKVIPYITQGRGDAMMMNWIYGGENAPKNTLQVFDGIDMPIDKIMEYAQQINEAVLNNWESDVLGDIVNDVTGFLDKTSSDGKLLLEAWDRAYEAAQKKKSSAVVNIRTPEQLIGAIIEMHRQNQARKTVFKKIGISVDHMGGSNTAFTKGPDGREWTLGQINDMIREELGERTVRDDVRENPDGSIDGEFTEIDGDASQIEDKRTPVEGEFSKLVVTDAATVMDGLLRETRNKPVAAAVRILKKANLKTRIVIGSPQEVSDWYSENIGDMDKGLQQDKKGIYDPVNDVMLITDNNHETLVHELIHAATFQTLENHYNGDTKHSDTVGRMETLMQEFMDLEIDSDAANSAKAQILALQVKTDAFSKAAALNEFMAWTLSNESLMKELGQKQTSVVARMAKVLKALMQRMLGGVKQDMLSNIQFNTELLINSSDQKLLPPPVEDPLDELTPGAQKFTNFWIDLAKQRLEEARTSAGTVSQKLKQISDYRKNAQSALDTLTFGGFTLSAYQQETFKAIHMVLALEMRLDTQSAAALNGMFQHVTDNLTPAMFGPNNEQDRYSAVMEIFGETQNDEGVSDAIAVLLALSQTSRGFRSAIDQLPVPESVENVSGDSLNEFLSSLTGMLMNKAVGSIDLSGQSVSETLDQLSESILLEESEKEFRILAGLMKNITKADDYLSGAFKKLAGYTEQVNDELRQSNRSNLTKLTFGAVTAATAFMDQDRAEIQADALKRVTHMGTNLDWAMPVREFVTEMIGTDENNKGIVSMLDEVTYAASSVRQNYREDLPVILQDTFDTHPNAEQWKATHKILGRTDFALVYDESRPNASFEMFKDENLIDQKIVQLEGAIRSNFPSATANTIIEKGQQLADFMNGKGAGHQLWRNAFAINKMAGSYKPNLTNEIDQLISLYAMKGSDPAMRREITRMYENDPIAMQNLTVYMKGLNKEEDLKVVSDQARMNGYKGYIPDLGQPGTKVIIAKDEDRRDLEKKGYKRVADAPADNGFSVENRGYYATTTKQTGTYSQGVMQLIQDTYRGVDATTGLSVNGMTSGLISGAGVDSVTNAMNNMTNGLPDNKEALLPVYDDSGVIYYERVINPDILEKFTAPKSNLAISLGAWAGRQVEEKFAQKYNQVLIDELKRVHDERGAEDDGLFVNLAEEEQAQIAWDNASKAQRRNMRKPDRVHVESWKVISPQTKRYIEEVFGKDTFFVRKDQVNIALGYRDPSVIDMWTGNTRVPEPLREGVQAITGLVMGDDAMRNMAATEGAVQGVVSTAKDLIVVRSLVVPYMNTQANVVQLSTRGIPVKQQFQGYKNKLSEIEKFNENRTKLIALETRIQLAGTDANKVRILEGQKQVILDENARMSVAPLIEAGAYKNISEGITELDVDLTTGRIGEWVENQTNKLPAGVQTVAKYGLLSKDTALYKGANKAVQYGDFIAKSIYYDHLIDKGLSHDDAMKLVNEEFVNFSVLPGRTRTYLEGMGATWFLTFKIRIMKIAMNQVRENPARSMILAATIADYGSPQADNLATVIADDRIGYALGWEMLFGSAGLNPWLNLYD